LTDTVAAIVRVWGAQNQSQNPKVAFSLTLIKSRGPILTAFLFLLTVEVRKEAKAGEVEETECGGPRVALLRIHVGIGNCNLELHGQGKATDPEPETEVEREA